MGKHVKKAFKAALLIFVALVIPGALGWITWKAVGTYVVSTFVLTLIGSMTSKGIDAGGGNFGTKFSSRSPRAPRTIVYGKCRVGANITYIGTSGTDNHKLHCVFALAGHEIQSLENIYINDTTVTSASGTENSETVYTITNSTFTNTDNDNAYTSGRLAKYTFENGSQTTANGFAVANTQLSSSSIGVETAYVYANFIYDAEKFSGFPNLAFEVKGKKLYDPRESGHTFGTESTYEWSDNPALAILDYLTNTRYGLGCPITEINITTGAGGFQSAANTCDQLVDLNSGGSIQEKRYTANGFVNMSADGEGVLESLLSSCAGRITYTNGKFNLFVGAAQTPSLTINDENVLGGSVLQTSSETTFNTCKAIYVNATNRYTSTDAPVLINSTFLDEDTPTGESSANYRSIMELQLPFTTSHHTAQRLQKIALNSNRKAKVYSLQTDINYMRLQPNDWVYLTNERFGYTDKTFEVVSTALQIQETNEGQPTLVCELQIKEVDASVFNYVFNEYSTPISDGGDPGNGDSSISAPTGLSLTQQANLEGSSYKNDIKASWTNIANDNIVATEVTYKLSTDASYTSSFTVGKGISNALIPNVVEGKTYNVKVRHQSSEGIFSDYTTAVNITIAITDAPSTPTNWTASSNAKFGIVLTWTNPPETNFRAVKIYRKTSTGTPTNDNNVVTTLGGEPNSVGRDFQNLADGLSAGTTYYFWIKAVNHLGVESSISSMISATFTAGPSDIGILSLADIDSDQDTKLDGVEAGATLGAKAGVNLKDSGNTVLDDEDFRNEDLAIDFTGNTTFRLKKGTTLIDSQSFSKTNVGLSDLASLDSTSSNKLGGIEANATVGATAGTNIKDSGDTVLGDDDLKNASITLNTDGSLNNIGTSQVLSNSKIAEADLVGTDKVFGVGQKPNKTVLTGNNLVVDGTSQGAVKNSGIELSLSGTSLSLTGGGGSAQTFNKGSVGLSDLNSLESGTGTKLGGIEAGATVGATAGTNLKDSSDNTLDDEDVRNSDLDIDTDGTSLRIKKGTTLIQSTTLDKGSVGLTNLNSLEAGTGTKLSGIATGATVGAVAGTNLKASDGTTTLNDDDVKNDSLDIDTDGTSLRIKKGSTVIQSTTLSKGSVGLSNLNSLESGTGTKLSGIAAGATVGAVLGTNLKASDGSTTLGDDDVKNDSLDIDTDGTSLRIKKGSTVIQSTTLSKGSVGLSNLNSLDTTANTKLSGIEAGATVGAQLDNNLVDENGNDLNSGELVTSQGTSNDTSNVNGRSASTVKTEAQVGNNAGINFTALVDDLNDPSSSLNITGERITGGVIEGSLIKTDELNLVTNGTSSSGVTITVNSTMSSDYIADLGTGAGMYMGGISVGGLTGSSIRGASIHLDIRAGSSSTNLYSKYFPIGQKESNQYYDAGDGYELGELTMEMEFMYFYTGTQTLKAYITADSNGTSSGLNVKCRAVKFGAEQPNSFTFTDETSLSAASNNTTYETSNTITLGGFNGNLTAKISGHSSAQMSINSGTFTSTDTSVDSGDTIQLRILKPSSDATTRSATLNVGGVQDTYTIATTGTYTPDPDDSYGCFAGGSLIWCGDGNYKPIEEVQVGETVMSYNQEINGFEPKEVTYTMTPKEDEIYKFTFWETSKELYMTDAHPILGADHKWYAMDPLKCLVEHHMSAEPLTQHTELLYMERELLTVTLKNIEMVGVQTVYNLSRVTDNENFIVDGFVAHNIREIKP